MKVAAVREAAKHVRRFAAAIMVRAIGGGTSLHSNRYWTRLAMADQPERDRNRRPAIAGLAIAVVLLVVGLWLAHELTAASKMQDCLMSGRTNCNVIPAQ
jgi:hypothetical protein